MEEGEELLILGTLVKPSKEGIRVPAFQLVKDPSPDCIDLRLVVVVGDEKIRDQFPKRTGAEKGNGFLGRFLDAVHVETSCQFIDISYCGYILPHNVVSVKGERDIFFERITRGERIRGET